MLEPWNSAPTNMKNLAWDGGRKTLLVFVEPKNRSNFLKGTGFLPNLDMGYGYAMK